MSLFKVRDFWSFELEQLQQHADESSPGSQTDNEDEAANFAAAIGRFSATGDDQDVVVAASLSGFMYIIRVPEFDTTPIQSRKNSRQLLAATKLDHPIIAIHCGYFTSALQQSIAVLDFHKVTIFQVKKRQVDLLSAALECDGHSPIDRDPETILVNESLLSHEFEEHYSLALITDAMPQSILVLNSHAESLLTRSKTHKNSEVSSVNPDESHHRRQESSKGRFLQGSTRIIQQLHLPQRDKIIVQYTNQFLLTLIESKKIIGHFRLSIQDISPIAANSKPPGEADIDEYTQIKSQQDAKLQEAATCVGPMSMAYLNNPSSRTSSLVISLSDYRIYCIPLDKLEQHAKQDIVKRVAINLLQSGQPSETSAKKSTIKEFGDPSGMFLVKIDLRSTSNVDWSRELLGQPIEMYGIQRRTRDALLPSNHEELIISQLIVMCRYELSLFSNSGQQLWSLKFETPLICFSAYTIEPETSKASVKANDELVVLLCASGLNENKSNLIVLKDEQIVWSALLQTKPMQIWRMNLYKMPGLLATLDVRQGLLTASYLGTNNQDQTLEDSNEMNLEEATTEDCFNKLEQLDSEPSAGQKLDCQFNEGVAMQKDLAVLVQLEAANEWPNVEVKCDVNILPSTNSQKVLHNVLATFEYDDSLSLRLAQESEHLSVVRSSRGMIQIRLGTCWPDRRESIKIKSIVSLTSNTKAETGALAMEKLDSSNMIDPGPGGSSVFLNLIQTPKTLKVNLLLEYQETHSGTLMQVESFLLPLSMLINLAHIDYTSGGQGQNLADVLNNLGSLYRLGYGQSDDGSSVESKQLNSKHYSCDIMINLECKMIELIDTLIESDLICRAQELSATERFERNQIVLEKLNLLAQSLGRRLRYRGQTQPNFLRQSSEDQLAPIMVSFALKFENSYEQLLQSIQQSQVSKQEANEISNRPPSSEDIIWVHICEIDDSDNLAKELIELHKPRRISLIGGGHLGDTAYGDGRARVLVSIESEHPMPVILFQQHFLERFKNLITTKIQAIEDPVNSSSTDFIVERVKDGFNMIAISSSLDTFFNSWKKSSETKFNAKYRQLNDNLAQEYTKLQVALKTSLSLAKRQPDLSDEMAEQSSILMHLTRHLLSKSIKLVNELECFKSLEYGLSKLPPYKI